MQHTQQHTPHTTHHTPTTMGFDHNDDDAGLYRHSQPSFGAPAGNAFGGGFGAMATPFGSCSGLSLSRPPVVQGEPHAETGADDGASAKPTLPTCRVSRQFLKSVRRIEGPTHRPPHRACYTKLRQHDASAAGKRSSNCKQRSSSSKSKRPLKDVLHEAVTELESYF